MSDDKINFNESIERYTTSTKGHADELNRRQDKLLENDKSLRKECTDFKLQLDKTTKQVETKMDKKIKDDNTNKQYELGIKDGFLYYKEVL